MAITIKRAEGIVEFCTDLALRGEWEQAQEELLTHQSKPSERLVDKEGQRLAACVVDLENRMAAAQLVFRLGAVGRKQWQETVAAHPPREDSEADAAMGTNVSTFFDALLSTPGTIISVNEKVSGKVVDFDPIIDWMPLADEMTDGQYSEFAQKVFELNRGVVARPTSRAASKLTGGSDENSKQRSASASA